MHHPIKQLLFLLVDTVFSYSSTAQLTFENRYPQNLNLARFNDFMVGDVDLDGDIDIVGSELDANATFSYAIYLNNGLGQYSKGNASYMLARTARYVLLDDFTGDGYPDLVQSVDLNNPRRHSFLLHVNNGAGGFNVDSTSLNFSTTYNSLPSKVFSSLDLDNDGDQDLIGIGGGTIDGNGQIIYLNDGAGGFTHVNHIKSRADNSDHAVQYADFSGNGYIDIPRLLNDTLSIYENKGNGVFEPSITNLFAYGCSRIAVLDANGDGRTDVLLYAGLNAAITALYINEGNGIFNLQTNTNLPSYFSSTDIRAADMDNDGDIDMVIYQSGTGRGADVALNNGNGSFVLLDIGHLVPSRNDKIGNVHLFDCDNDLDVDIFLSINTLETTSSQYHSEIYFNDLYATGIESLKQIEIQLYPNPAQNTLQLNGIEEPCNYSIYTLQGSLVQTGRANPGEGIEVARLTKGMYVFQLETGERVKFVKE